MSKATIKALVIGGVVLALMIAGAFMFGGPIIRYVQGKLDRAEAQVEQATDQGVSNELETQGAEVIGGLAADRAEQETGYRARDAARAQIIKVNPDVQTPLPADVADLIRRADLELCAAGGPRCRTDGGDGPSDPDAGPGS